MKELETLLSAINMADMDGVKELTVSIEDLRLLRKTIIQRGELIEKLENAFAEELAFKIKCVSKAKMLKDYK